MNQTAQSSLVVSPWRVRAGRARFSTFLTAFALASPFSVGVAAAQEGTLQGATPLPGGRWIGAAQPTIETKAGQTVMTIDQEQSKALLDWSTFDVGVDERVHFEQDGVDWIALNRIFDSKPSQIAGQITARGQVWLMNTNGIVFQGTSRVNVHSLLATTATIDEEAFFAGVGSGVGTDNGLPVLRPEADPFFGFRDVPREVDTTLTDGDINYVNMALSVIRRGALLQKGVDADDSSATYGWGGQSFGAQFSVDERVLPLVDADELDSFARGLELGAYSDVSADAFAAANSPQSLQLLLNDPVFVADVASQLRTQIGGDKLGERQAAATARLNAYLENARIVVERGAEITAKSEVSTTPGKIMLLGVNVENAGKLTANDGQIVLAAGEEIYLFSNQGVPNERNTTVEVSPALRFDSRNTGQEAQFDADLRRRGELVGNTVVNTGEILAERGEINLVGREIVQSGVVRTTTGVRQRAGNIDIRASWGAYLAPFSADNSQQNLYGGSITFTAGSVTENAIDAGAELGLLAENFRIDYSGFAPHDVFITARDILFDSGSVVRSPGGDIYIYATPTARTPFSINDPVGLIGAGSPGSVTIRSGALIDASGLDDVLFDMAQNSVEVEVRGNELAASPLQRGGVLAGEVVDVDVRVGADIIDWTGALPSRSLTAQQRATDGGSITLLATSSVVMEDGATLDVSGGSRRYLDGEIATTQLVGPNGLVVDIADADPNVIYIGIIRGTRFEKGYVEGGDAGAIDIKSPTMRLFGEAKAEVFVGERQRRLGWDGVLPKAPAGALEAIYDAQNEVIGFNTLRGDRLPVGGSLTIGSVSPEDSSFALDNFFVTADEQAFTTRFLNQDRIIDPFVLAKEGQVGQSPLSGRAFAFVEDDFISGFQTVSLQVPGRTGGVAEINPDAQINLLGDGSFTFLTTRSAIRLREGASISAPSSSFAFFSERGATTLDDGVSLSVDGHWLNDVDLAAGAYAGGLDGGLISFDTGVVFGGDATLSANGGGWWRRTGYDDRDPRNPPDFELLAGDSGRINVILTSATPLSRFFSDVSLSVDGLNGAGIVSLFTPQSIVIGPEGSESSAPSNAFFLSDAELNSLGFGTLFLGDPSFRITSPNLTILDGAKIAPRTASWSLTTAPGSIASGARLSDYADRIFLSDIDRPTNTLRVSARTMIVAEGAAFDMGPMGSLNLSANSRLEFYGDARAPGGDIQLSGADGILWVGGDAEIDVSGTALTERLQFAPGPGGVMIRGSVLDGGAISLGARRLMLEEGASLRADGATGVLQTTVAGFRGAIVQERVFGSDGGTISVGGAFGYALADASAQGGLAENANGTIVFGTTASADPMVFDSTVTQRPATAAPTTNGLRNPMIIGRPMIESISGFDTLRFEGDAGIYFAQDQVLSTRRSIEVASTLLSDSLLTLNTSRLHFFGYPSLVPSIGEGTGVFTANADVIEFRDGIYRLDGFDTVNLNARGSIFGGSGDESFDFKSGLTSSGDLNLRASQIYPLTGQDLSFEAAGDLVIRQSGASSAPLSAGGRLYLRADNILQAGTLRAPFGLISLEAEGDITLAAGSITSASADGRTIQYGYTVDGAGWYAPNLRDSVDGLSAPIYAPPEKRVSLDAANITVASGSVVDVSGGGDVVALEFLPGPDGRVDLLSQPRTFAVSPLIGTSVDSAGSTALGGDIVYLEAFDGLPAGWYTLLPASYALTPGAYLITESERLVVGGSLANADRSFDVAGYTAVAGTPIRDQNARTFRLERGETVRSHAQYIESLGNTFFTSDLFLRSLERSRRPFNPDPRVSADGGALTLAATQSLSIEGTVDTSGDRSFAGARGGIVDITSQNIVVASEGADVSDLSGYLTLRTEQLAALAESVLIGGVRVNGQSGTEIDVSRGAENVVIRTTKDDPLSISEVLLTAREEIIVEDGAAIVATGDGVDAAALSFRRSDGAPDRSAFVRVSNLGATVVDRSNTIVGAGDVTVGEDALLKATDAVDIQASGDVLLPSSAVVQAATISVGASRVALGDAQASGSGLVLDQAALDRLRTTSTLRLSSLTTFDTYGDVAIDVGDALEFDGAGMRAVSDGNVAIRADALALSNSRGTIYDAASATGALTADVDTLELGAGTFTIGAAEASIRARESVSGVADGALDALGSLTFRTPLVRVATGYEYDISSAGSLRLLGEGEAVASAADLGAILRLTGESVEIGTQILARSGVVDVLARSGDIRIGSGGSIDVSGGTASFFEVSEPLRAGSVRLRANEGRVSLDTGSMLNLAGGSTGVDAGSLSISGLGAFESNGVIDASFSGDARGGSFDLAVGSVENFDGLSARLTSSGFTRSQSFDLDMASLDVAGALTADDIRIANSGDLTVAGALSTGGADDGSIVLASGGLLTVMDSARLDASADAAGVNGGEVVLLVGDAGALNVGAATIEVGGGSGGADGVVKMRVARRGSGAAIDRFDATVEGGVTQVEAYRVFDAAAFQTPGEIHEADQAMLVADAIDFAVNNNIASDLGVSSDARFEVLAGIEVRSTGDLRLADDWNLAAARYDGRPGVLTLRAGGNLALDADLSDGFKDISRGLAQYVDPSLAVSLLTNDRSWSYNLVAGADFGDVDPLATRFGAEADVLVRGLVRTGTGDINVSSARDLHLIGEINGGAIYTAGVEAAPVANFTAPFAYQVRALDDVNPIEYQYAHYAVGGGDVTIDVGRDVLGDADPFDGFDVLLAPSVSLKPGGGVRGAQADPSQPFAPGFQTSASVRYGLLQNGVGALGGGDVTVRAGRDIDNLVALSPTTERVSGGRTVGEAKTHHITGGGDLTVEAGRDILGGLYVVSRGEGRIAAAGDIGESDRAAVNRQAVTGSGIVDVRGRRLMVGMDDARVAMEAGGDLTIGYIRSPRPSLNALPSWIGFEQSSRFSALALGGDVSYRGVDVYRSNFTTQLESSTAMLPAQSKLISTSGDVYIGGLRLVDAQPNTQLDVFAARDITGLGAGSGQVIGLNDYEAAPRAFNPGNGLEAFVFGGIPYYLIGGPGWGFYDPTRNVHEDSTAVSRLYAGRDILDNDPLRPGVSVVNEVTFGAETRLKAGRDINLTDIRLVTHDADDLSMVQAGRYITLTAGFPLGLKLYGPGDLWVQAGSDIFLGGSQTSASGGIRGIETLDLVDPRRPSGAFKDLFPSVEAENGGDVYVLAGINQEPEYEAFFEYYLNPDAPGSNAYLKQYFTFDQFNLPSSAPTVLADGTPATIYAVELINFMRERRGAAPLAQTDETGRDLPPGLLVSRISRAEYDQAVAEFSALSADERAPLATRILLAELKTSGREAVRSSPLTDPRFSRGGDPTRGYDAIGRLFPGAQRAPGGALQPGESAWAGNIVMGNSSIRADGGGDSFVIAPGGFLQLASLSVSDTSPAVSGLLSQRGGSVGVLTYGDVAVNQSRILTADGGDILVWSSFGDIDAGRGRKSSLSIPPIQYTMDKFLTSRIIRSGIPNGAGIATLDTVDGLPGGDVDLYAFQGLVDAGDAGIRASRDLFIGALEIRNIDNITVGGVTNVILPVESTGETAINVENFARSAEERAIEQALDITEQVDRLRQSRPTLLTGSVLSFDEDRD